MRRNRRGGGTGLTGGWRAGEPVCVIAKDRLAPVAAIQDVIYRSLEFDACFAGHPPRSYATAAHLSIIERDSQTEPTLYVFLILEIVGKT